VYFSTHEYNKVQFSTVELLRGLDVTWPTDESQRYFRSAIAPPRGTSKSIRLLFGYEEMPSAIQRGGTPLTKLNDALPVILSFVLTPAGMATICALSKRIRAVAWDAQAWSHNIIDTRGIQPMGFQAHRHWLLWRRAKHVINGNWTASNVGLLMCKEFAAWRWLQRQGSMCTHIYGKVVYVSQSRVPLNVTLLVEESEGDLIVGVTNARYPEHILESWMTPSCNYVFYGALLQPNETTLFTKLKDVVSENTTRHEKVPDGASFVTLSVSHKNIELRVSGPMTSSYTISAEHDECIHPTLGYFCVVISNTPCHIAPCWTLM